MLYNQPLRITSTLITGLMFLTLIGCGDTDEESQNSGTTETSAFTMNCEALGQLFKTEATQSVQDWSGFWECYQAENGCSGEQCTYATSSLPSYLLNGDCEGASSCTIDGQTVNECETVQNTGYVDIDCSVDGSIGITMNGLPDHTIENYSTSGTIPPLLGSAETGSSYTLSTNPEFSDEAEFPSPFDSSGGSYGIAANGVNIFNQFTGMNSIAVTDETVDDCGGHPANNQYHYHSLPACGWLNEPEQLGSAGNHSGLMGLWLDSFPILGPYGFNDPADTSSDVVRLKSCYTMSACNDDTDADCYTYDTDSFDEGSCHLDVCNGRTTAVPESLQAALGTEIYAYYMTVDEAQLPAFPYLPFCYRGEAASGSGSSGGGPGPGQGPGNGPPS